MSLVVLLVGLALFIVIVALYLAALSRHKKSATNNMNLMGAGGVVDSALEPEGSVIVNGELWRARLANGNVLAKGIRIRVVGFAGHLVLVEPLSDKL